MGVLPVIGDRSASVERASGSGYRAESRRLLPRAKDSGWSKPMTTPSRLELPLVDGGEALGSVVGNQCGVEPLEIAIENLWQRMQRQTHTMVGDSVLLEVIGADLLRAFSGADLRPSSLCLFALLLGQLLLVEPSSQHTERFEFVLQL